ncbi:MAG TPA: RNA polymerase sigma factor [Planctomycetota bacterium]|nr:RNA polymerase sigma factor [Planctomycetota bacterium]
MGGPREFGRCKVISEGKQDFDLVHLQQRMFQVAYMMVGDPSVSEELAQEAIARVVEHRDQFRGEGDGSGWAYSIVVNLCRKRKREHRRQLTLTDPALLERTTAAQPRHGPSTSVILHETYERAAVAVQALSPVLREVFVLHYVEGLSYADVANIVGISQGAARLRAKRARESLKTSLASFLSPGIHQTLQAESSLSRPK